GHVRTGRGDGRGAALGARGRGRDAALPRRRAVASRGQRAGPDQPPPAGGGDAHAAHPARAGGRRAAPPARAARAGPPVRVGGAGGQPFGKALGRPREYVEIVRAILQREKPLEFRGEYYQIPYAGPNATGLGKPLKSILHGRASLPIYLAAVGPKNVALAAEIADGWIPVFFSARRSRMFRE